ncbi:MAG TPA: glycosyltransferase, partial [Candidatus Paceibacterota bacterium]
MRIAIVTDQYLPQLGGVPDSIVTVTKGLRKLGHTVRIYAPHLPGSLSDSDVERLPTVTFQGGMGALVSPFGLHKRLSEWRPDVVHVHSVGIAAFAGMRAARALHIPAVATCHGSMADYLYHLHLDIWPIPYLVKRAEGWYFNHASLVTAPAQKPLDGIIEHGARPAHMHVISNPIDCDLFHALEYRAAIKKKLGIGPRAVLLFGRIAQEKNLELAIEILANVSKK